MGDGVHNVQRSVQHLAAGKRHPHAIAYLFVTWRSFQWLSNSFADQQHVDDEMQKLKVILAQLERPINRSATQLSELHDALKSE